jgi:hypothetical protein
MRQDYPQPFRTEVQVQANETFKLSVAAIIHNASKNSKKGSKHGLPEQSDHELL